MPIYEYVCESCGESTEVMQKVSDPAPRTCPACGADRLARAVSRTSFQLKGGGWYADLYASKKAAGATGDGAADSTKPSADKGSPDKKPSTNDKPATTTAPAAPAAPAAADKRGGGSGTGSSGGAGGPGAA